MNRFSDDETGIVHIFPGGYLNYEMLCGALSFAEPCRSTDGPATCLICIGRSETE